MNRAGFTHKERKNLKLCRTPASEPQKSPQAKGQEITLDQLIHG
jgi:hypothetical protein